MTDVSIITSDSATVKIAHTTVTMSATPTAMRIDQSSLKEMIFTDSIPYTKKSEKITVLSVADMFAEAIRRVCHDESISSLYAIK